MFTDHWVAWTQVAGLMVGLFGLFFVSVDIVGDTFTRWLIALLPATGIGLGWLLIFLPLAPQIASLIQLPVSQSGFRWFQVGLAAYCFLGGYFATVLYGGARIRRKQRAKTDSSSPTIISNAERFGRITGRLTVAMPAALLPAIVTVILYLNHTLHDSSLQTAIVIDVGWFVYTWCYVVVAQLPLNLEGKQLQRIGIVMTVLAVITQFIPPVVELVSASFK
jgi:hypothetical protein